MRTAFGSLALRDPYALIAETIIRLSGARKDHGVALLAFDSCLVHTCQQEAELELYGA